LGTDCVNSNEMLSVCQLEFDSLTNIDPFGDTSSIPPPNASPNMVPEKPSKPLFPPPEPAYGFPAYGLPVVACSYASSPT
jgi:hypothetical protein